jgi:hypothetical protein
MPSNPPESIRLVLKPEITGDIMPSTGKEAKRTKTVIDSDTDDGFTGSDGVGDEGCEVVLGP